MRALLDVKLLVASLGAGHLHHGRGVDCITDAYLLALAVQNHGTLISFDRSIALGAVPGALKADLTVLGGAA